MSVAVRGQHLPSCAKSLSCRRDACHIRQRPAILGQGVGYKQACHTSNTPLSMLSSDTSNVPPPRSNTSTVCVTLNRSKPARVCGRARVSGIDVASARAGRGVPQPSPNPNRRSTVTACFGRRCACTTLRGGVLLIEAAHRKRWRPQSAHSIYAAR